MKKIKLLSAFILFFGFIKAQDILVMRNGDEIKAKVLEMNQTEIKYKRFENIEGVLYVINKSDVFMVKYENGTKDIITALPGESSTANTYNKKSPYKSGRPERDATFYEKKSKRGIIAGAVLTGVGVPMMCTGVALLVTGVAGDGILGSGNGSDFFSTMGFIASGVILSAGGLAMSIIGPISLGRGLHYRKVARDMKPSLSLLPICEPTMIGFSSNVSVKAGVGINLRF